jgi:hypothetical protein
VKKYVATGEGFKKKGRQDERGKVPSRKDECFYN